MSHHGLVFAVRGLLVATLLGWVASAAWAGPYTGLVIFGDSLSDVGTAWIASNHAYPPPNSGYDEGRYSNGPLWLEDLAAALNVPHSHLLSCGGNRCRNRRGNFGNRGS